jgi:thiol-disulfide isomerase/thioredoxin
MLRKSLCVLITVLAATAFAGEELNVGAKAPAFALINAANGQKVTFTPADNKVKVVVFTCNQCPYAKAFEPRLIALGRTYAKKGVAFYAVNPNDDSLIDLARFRSGAIESMDNMQERAVENGYPFPYLKDGDSATARAYGARVTPHVFVVDGKGIIRYRGYVDDSAKPEQRAHMGLSDALDALVANSAVKVTATKAFGCSIKWKNKA